MLSNSWLRFLRRITIGLRKVPGAIVFLEPLRRLFLSCTDCITVHDFDGSLSARLCLNKHMQSQIFWYGYYSRDIVLLLDRILKPGMVVMDAGANIGEITMSAAHRVGPDGKVFSFEPMSPLYARLQEHIEENDLTQVTAIKSGLSDCPGKADIYESETKFQDGSENEGLGSLYKSTVRSVAVEEIEIDTVDVFFKKWSLTRLDLIKIDVEGAELQVLKGGLDTISRMHPYIIIEIQDETAHDAGYEAVEILRLLKSFGYRFHDIGRKARLREVSETSLSPFQNVLCIPADRAVV